MLADFEARHGSGYKTYWTRPETHGERPLKLDHYILAFIMFACSTTISLIAFVIELWLGRKNGGKSREQNQRKRNQKFVRDGEQNNFMLSVIYNSGNHGNVN